jgi:hypothetical protein
MTETRLPPLPSASVDFNVLHDALAKGEEPVVAAAMAVAAGRGQGTWEAPSLKGKTLDQLRKIAEDEEAPAPETDDKTGLIAAIEGKRIADMLGESAPTPPPVLPDPPVDGEAK